MMKLLRLLIATELLVGKGFYLCSYTDVYPSGDGEAFPIVDTECLVTNRYHVPKIVVFQLALEKSSYLLGSLWRSLVWGLL